jgi:hypothetical protein
LLGGLAWLVVGNAGLAGTPRPWLPTNSEHCDSCGGNSYDEGYVPAYRTSRTQTSDCGDCSGGDCGYPYRWPQGARASGNGCCASTCHDRTYCGPLTWVFSLFARDSWYGPGCGERYWGDFYSDPPDTCDPCDRSGHYTGGGYGYRSNGYVSGGYAGGGYVGGSTQPGKSCNCGNHQAFDYTLPAGGRVISQGEHVVSQDDRAVEQVPTPAPKPHKAQPKPMQPQN